MLAAPPFDRRVHFDLGQADNCISGPAFLHPLPGRAACS